VSESAVYLNDEQHAIVTAPPDARTVVFAGAGTGKTEVLAHRLAHLVEAYDVSPGSGLLVLSFSRNAVAEIRRRLKLATSAAGMTRVFTFDSYASRLLRLGAAASGWEDKGFDGRIQAAADLVDTDPSGLPLSDVRHLVVDEVQDLVGDRAEFVLAILRRVGDSSGFTLLGDPAQGIYDFQLENARSKLTARGFLRQVFELSPQPVIRELTVNHRARTAQVKRIGETGGQLRQVHEPSPSLPGPGSGDMDPPTQAQILFDRLPIYPVREAARMLIPERLEGGSAAVLCRTNASALAWSRALQDAGLRHTLRPRLTELPVARWVARFLRGVTGTAVTEQAFIRWAQESALPGDPGLMWRDLKRTEGRTGSDLSLAYLTARIATGSVAEALIGTESEPVVVSTIHRAKGLEWDIVLIAEMSRPQSPGPQEDGQAFDRLLYVAMTRARDELYRVDTPAGYIQKAWVGKRERHCQTERRSGPAIRVELLAEDIPNETPAVAGHLAGAVEAQQYLDHHVNAGDPVDLVLDATLGAYLVQHERRTIGTTHQELAATITELAGRGQPPAALRGGRVECVEAVAGSPAAGKRAGLGSSGVWLRPRLAGLADFVWEG
jgi:hypothetical protein